MGAPVDAEKTAPSTLIQSIQRAMIVLRSFTESEPELTVGELSRRLDLHKSTVSRILTTLQYEGMVSQNPENGKYRLGVGLISLAGVALGRLDVRGVAQPHLPALVELSQETVSVVTLDGHECVTIERLTSPKQIHYVGWIGRRTPLHCTAAGKVFLAYMNGGQLQAALPAVLPRYTQHTETNWERLTAVLRQIKEQAYAIEHEEYEEGFSAIAAPLFNHAGEVAGVISISGPTFRLEDGRLRNFTSDLQQTAQQISAELGYQPHTEH